MTTPKYTVPATADFVLVIQRKAGVESIHMAMADVSLNQAKDFTPALFWAAVRTAATAVYDRCIKKSAKDNPHLAVADMADVLDYGQKYVDSDGLPAFVGIKAVPDVPGRDPIISTNPPAAVTQ